MDDCGEVLDYLEVSDSTWETTGFSCPNRAEKGELQPLSSPGDSNSRLGPTLRGGVIVGTPGDNFTRTPSRLGKAEPLEGMASDEN